MAKAKAVVSEVSTPVTKPPKISRIEFAGSAFKITWTKGETYSGAKSGIKIRCCLMTTAGIKQDTGVVKLSASATTYTYNIDKTTLYPATDTSPVVYKVFVEVLGKTNGKLWSMAAHKELDIAPPEKPTITHTDPDSQHQYTTTFTFNAADAGAATYTDIAIQSFIKENCPGDDLASLSEWQGQSVTSKADGGTATYAETGIATKSARRCVRAKARGIGGDSAWEYDSYAYSKPAAPQNTQVKAVYDSDTGNVRFESNFDTPSDSVNPVDYVMAQYLLTVPGPGMSVPAGATFSDYAAVTDTANVDGIAGDIGAVPDLDEVLFIRFKSVYGLREETSAVSRALISNLKQPTDLSVSTDQVNYRATIEAENTSDVPDSYLAIYYKQTTTPEQQPFMIGYIAHGQTSATVQCPNWTDKTPVAFGVKAIAGSTPTYVTRGNYRVYSIAQVNMESDMQWVGGAVPVAPTGTSAEQIADDGTVLVKWNWEWEEADAAELSWADHSDAWESTDEPETYEVSNLHAAQWKISRLTTGERWYIRVRLLRHNGEEVTYGPYCNVMSVDLSAAPAVPVMRVDKKIIKPNGDLTVTWSYESNDGTLQNYAEVFEVANGTYTQIANTKTAQHITLHAGTGKLAGWTANTQHTIALRVWSDSNRNSGYSSSVTVTIANPLTCTITAGAGFQTVDGQLQLKALPAVVTVTGAGTAGQTTLAIERTQSYDLETPDEQTHTGYEGETVYLFDYPGQNAVTINYGDLIGRLDDTAAYRIVATVADTYGQTAKAEADFIVSWTNQALMPEGTATIDAENGIGKIMPTAPTGAQTGDTVNIYRLSMDKPQLIYEGAEFGETYVDPYPTVGDSGGYRLAYMTKNGDFITASYVPAILDISAPYNVQNHIIDFGFSQVTLELNLTSSHNWEKGFQQTKYLGGAVQGDWLAGVLRSGSVAAVSYVPESHEVAEALRRLAVYDGLCHVRTADGSNFTANVNVSEDMGYESAGKIASFQIDIQACDNPNLDGMLLSDWEEQ